MKRIVAVNGLNYASTGKICLNISEEARKNGYEVETFFRNSKEGKKHLAPHQHLIGYWLDKVISERLCKITGLIGYFNVINTTIFINELKKIKPDLIHLHSLCDSYLNVNMLFRYLKKADIPVIWTLHDSFPFTGRCAQNRCTKWKEGCGNCPHKDYYPGTLFLDNSKHVLKTRSKIYNDLNRLTIVTPSKWLAELTEESHFGDHYPIEVINNGIDLSIFHPVENSFRKDHNLEGKFLILGLAYYWDESKGLDVFMELSKRLDERYQIIMVGTNDELDKLLSPNIISIHRTHSQEELVKIYSACDLFVNPTRDENYPTVHMEAVACGLPVLTFDVGGCKEMLNEKCGDSVPVNDTEGLIKKIEEIYEKRPFNKKDCLDKAQSYNHELKYKEYVDLYNKLLKD
ncbi:MAG: glycosyltransferase [Erysipelotrichaceae bacterium]|nr:glycosyltransferase [Erysipelotrichaceae bacterium]